MVVSCKLVGGLGNCLFIIATTIAYALKHGIDYCIPETIENPHEPEQKVFHSDKLNYCAEETLVDVMGLLDEEIYIEPFFQYQEIPEFQCDRLILSGYFQSYKYFNDYRPEILTLLNIPKAIGYGRIFLHKRLGDYKTLGKFHKIISDEYIKKALDLFYEKGYRDILLFSDEPQEAASTVIMDHRFTYQVSEGRTPLQDLSLMAACSGGIMSPSSYSYWGAWLGHQDRLITYPLNWFGEAYAETHSIKDLPMPNWIGL